MFFWFFPAQVCPVAILHPKYDHSFWLQIAFKLHVCINKLFQQNMLRQNRVILWCFGDYQQLILGQVLKWCGLSNPAWNTPSKENWQINMPFNMFQSDHGLLEFRWALWVFSAQICWWQLKHFWFVFLYLVLNLFFVSSFVGEGLYLSWIFFWGGGGGRGGAFFCFATFCFRGTWIQPKHQYLIEILSFYNSGVTVHSPGRGDSWCNSWHICFPSLPPMLLCGFKSRLGLESSGFSMWHFLKLIARGFLRVLQFPPLLHRFNGSANEIKFK